MNTWSLIMSMMIDTFSKHHVLADRADLYQAGEFQSVSHSVRS